MEKKQLLSDKQIAKIKDSQRIFLHVFNTEVGKQVIEHLEKYAHVNYPNYDNVYATYAKAGQQQMVDYIKGMVEIAKKGGL